MFAMKATMLNQLDSKGSGAQYATGMSVRISVKAQRAGPHGDVGPKNRTLQEDLLAATGRRLAGSCKQVFLMQSSVKTVYYLVKLGEP